MEMRTIIIRRGIILFVLTITIVLLTLNIGPVSACSCLIPEPAEKLEHSDAVFVGRVIPDSNDGFDIFGSEYFRNKFLVLMPIKGTTETAVTVSTGKMSRLCGFDSPFPIGHIALIYADETRSGLLSTGLCSGNIWEGPGGSHDPLRQGELTKLVQ